MYVVFIKYKQQLKTMSSHDLAKYISVQINKVYYVITLNGHLKVLTCLCDKDGCSEKHNHSESIKMFFK